MKKGSLCIALVSLLAISCVKENGDQLIREMSSVRGYKNWFIDDFRCGLFVPPSYDNTKKYPLIIFLHGYTDTTTWDLKWYNEPFVTEDPCIVLTPKCPKEQEYGWGSSFDPRTTPMMTKAFEMMEMADRAFSLDKDRYYIYGSSMGGYGTYFAIKKNPEMFAAAYVECGSSSKDMAPIIAKMPFWMFHGSEDPIVPVQPTRDLYQAVLDIGGTTIRYTEYQGVGHNAWDYTGKETTLPYWLLAQRKGSVHEAPQPVYGFKAVLTPESRVSMRWELPSGTSGDDRIWYCKVYRDGQLIREVYNDCNIFTDSTSLQAGDHKYKITGVNFHFKESSPSQEVTINSGK
jgi:predicted esterase